MKQHTHHLVLLAAAIGFTTMAAIALKQSNLRVDGWPYPPGPDATAPTNLTGRVIIEGITRLGNPPPFLGGGGPIPGAGFGSDPGEEDGGGSTPSIYVPHSFDLNLADDPSVVGYWRGAYFYTGSAFGETPLYNGGQLNSAVKSGWSQPSTVQFTFQNKMAYMNVTNLDVLGFSGQSDFTIGAVWKMSGSSTYTQNLYRINDSVEVKWLSASKQLQFGAKDSGGSWNYAYSSTNSFLYETWYSYVCRSQGGALSIWIEGVDVTLPGAGAIDSLPVATTGYSVSYGDQTAPRTGGNLLEAWAAISAFSDAQILATVDGLDGSKNAYAQWRCDDFESRNTLPYADRTIMAWISLPNNCQAVNLTNSVSGTQSWKFNGSAFVSIPQWLTEYKGSTPVGPQYLRTYIRIDSAETTAGSSMVLGMSNNVNTPSTNNFMAYLRLKDIGGTVQGRLYSNSEALAASWFPVPTDQWILVEMYNQRQSSGAGEIAWRLGGVLQETVVTSGAYNYLGTSIGIDGPFEVDIDCYGTGDALAGWPGSVFIKDLP